MKNRDLIVGLVAVALVGAGVFWVRSRPASPTRSGAGVPAESAPGPEQAPVGYTPRDEVLPDVTLEDGAVERGGVRIVMSLAPRPPAPLTRLRVRVRAEASGKPVPLEGGLITFEMTMPMGNHRYALTPGADAWQEAEVTLPVCPSGNRRWFATIEGNAAGRVRMARFRLDLAVPPGK